MLGDIPKLAVKDFAELVKGVGVDIRVLAKAVELPRAYVEFVYQLVLGYAFFFEGLPQFVVDNHIGFSLLLLKDLYILLRNPFYKAFHK